MIKKIPLQLLIYDLDGTLVDSRKDLCIAANYMLSQLGLPIKEEPELRRYIGKGIKHLVVSALDGRENFFPEGLKIMLSFYQQHCTDQTALYEGVKKTLEYFKEKKQFVLTNKIESISKMILERLEIADYFIEIMGDREGKQRKPDPTRVLQLLDKSAVPSSQAAMVGDSAIDIETGRRAKVLTAFIRGGIGKIEENQPDIVLSSFSELKNYFM